MMPKRLLASALCSLAMGTISQAALISGPTQITATTSISAGGFGSIDQIVDGIGMEVDGEPFNGYGADVESGTIRLDLNGTYTIYDFILANDINVQHEGVRDFQLSFYDSLGTLISTTGIFTAADASVPSQNFTVGTVVGVNRVDFLILNVHTEETLVDRIEIREVAFNGIQQVPEPSSLLLGAAGALSLLARRRRN